MRKKTKTLANQLHAPTDNVIVNDNADETGHTKGIQMMLDKALQLKCEAMHTTTSPCNTIAEYDAEVNGVAELLCRNHYYTDADENQSLRAFVGAA